MRAFHFHLKYFAPQYYFVSWAGRRQRQCSECSVVTGLSSPLIGQCLSARPLIGWLQWPGRLHTPCHVAQTLAWCKHSDHTPHVSLKRPRVTCYQDTCLHMSAIIIKCDHQAKYEAGSMSLSWGAAWVCLCILTGAGRATATRGESAPELETRNQYQHNFLFWDTRNRERSLPLYRCEAGMTSNKQKWIFKEPFNSECILWILLLTLPVIGHLVYISPWIYGR